MIKREKLTSNVEQRRERETEQDNNRVQKPPGTAANSVLG